MPLQINNVMPIIHVNNAFTIYNLSQTHFLNYHKDIILIIIIIAYLI